eukprot:Pgem_evm1s15344
MKLKLIVPKDVPFVQILIIFSQIFCVLLFMNSYFPAKISLPGKSNKDNFPVYPPKTFK